MKRLINKLKENDLSEHPNYFTCTWKQLIHILTGEVPNEEGGEVIINLEDYTMDKAKEWFKQRYEDHIAYREIYFVDEEGEDRMKSQYEHILFEKADMLEEELLKFAPYDKRTDKEGVGDQAEHFTEGIPL